MAVTPTYGGDTTNYGLKKLDLSDAADFGIVNANMDIVDSTLAAKVDAQAGKGLSSNDYTTAEKNKLAGIEAQANKTVIDNSLSSTSTTHALSAAQGKALSDTIGTKARLFRGQITNASPFVVSQSENVGWIVFVGRSSAGIKGLYYIDMLNAVIPLVTANNISVTATSTSLTVSSTTGVSVEVTVIGL